LFDDDFRLRRRAATPILMPIRRHSLRHATTPALKQPPFCHAIVLRRAICCLLYRRYVCRHYKTEFLLFFMFYIVESSLTPNA